MVLRFKEREEAILLITVDPKVYGKLLTTHRRGYGVDVEALRGRFPLRRCRGGRTADAKGWLKRGGGSRALVGFGGEVDMRGCGTPDISRFGALRRDNTPSPAECSWTLQ